DARGRQPSHSHGLHRIQGTRPRRRLDRRRRRRRGGRRAAGPAQAAAAQGHAAGGAVQELEGVNKGGGRAA
ncbi:hypothetical protein DFJ74DRAFT_770780, partial [Hyaloraphidium curvatum]